MSERPSLDQLRKLRMLRDFSGAALEAVREHATLMPVGADRALLAEGERNDRLHFVLEGRITIWRASDVGRLVLTECGPGATLGEVTFLEPGIASATATSAETSTLISLDHDVLTVLEADHPEEALALYKRLAITLKNRLVDTTALMLTHRGIRHALEEMEELRVSVGSLFGGQSR